jgi:intracellular protein transport protein USO1
MDLNFFKTGITGAYDALRGPAGQPQNAVDTIQKLADRLSQATLLSDRRAATLTLKGLARDCKADVGQIALEPLLASLQTDAKADPDICRALLETLVTLCECEVPEGAKAPRDQVGLRHTDTVLAVGRK